MPSVALVGYGEVGQILAEELRGRGVAVSAHDIRDDQRLEDHAGAHGVRWCTSHAEAVAGADVVVCAVTADQDVAAATSSVEGLPAGAFFVDVNSASPGAKRRAAELVDAAGGRYVEAAVMTSLPPHRLRVPILLGGPHARLAEPVLQDLGFDQARFHDERLGVSSATKLCRSVMVKGLEALVVESFTAARAHGVEDAVLASLAETFPGIDWEQQGAYFFQRTIQHGRRRSEEMFEAARTVAEAGLEPLAAQAVAERQAWMADQADAGVFGERGAPGFASSPDWRTEADRILGHRTDEAPPASRRD